MKIILGKTVAIILSVLILCTLLNSISAFADQSKSVDVTCSVDKTTVSGDQSFTETIGLSNFVNVVGGVQAFKFVIDYDSSKFSSTVSAINGRTTHTQKNANGQDVYYSDLTVTQLANQLVIIYLENGSGATPISTDGPVLTVKFTVNTYAISGVTNFVLSSGDIDTFVDCDAAMPPDLRDVYPQFSSTSTQLITVSNITKGDVNDDGFINSADALMVLKAASGKISLSESEIIAADVNNSGTITSADALEILKYASGKIKIFS